MADRAHALGCSGLAPVQFTTIYSPACLGSEIATLAHADQVRPGKARGEHFLSAVPPRAVVAAPRQHLRSGPCMDGSGLSREVGALQRWSVQPCVRPVDAAHMAAGHNAFRRSCPGQFLAFCDALAQVGCPDHRIDPVCITCCRPFPTVRSRRSRRDLVLDR